MNFLSKLSATVVNIFRKVNVLPLIWAFFVQVTTNGPIFFAYMLSNAIVFLASLLFGNGTKLLRILNKLMLMFLDKVLSVITPFDFDSLINSIDHRYLDLMAYLGVFDFLNIVAGGFTSVLVAVFLWRIRLMFIKLVLFRRF